MGMNTMHRLLLALACCAVLATGCGGGGNSSVTTITGPGVSAGTQGPVVTTGFVQAANNLAVAVDGGPAGSFSLGAANILYATVTVCVPGTQAACRTIDHVQVDTGSVGLRILASKVGGLGLPAVQLAPGSVAVECYPFVIGGLWGPNAVADVRMGQEWAPAVPIQLIDDDPNTKLAPPLDCVNAANGQVLSSASALASNGVLGIGSVTLDCGLNCTQGNYTGGYVQYYSCPAAATSALQCAPVAVPANLQVFNPVAALPLDNNGVVLSLPQVTGLGAARAEGELIFGVGTRSNNQLAPGAAKVNLGVQYIANPDSYLSVTTLYQGRSFANSYLDTGTNGLFFDDPAIARCASSSWYCPASGAQETAILSDGDLPQANQVPVQFGVANADALFSTTNVAFAQLAGAQGGSPSAAQAFAWGLPFFYGRRVFLSIWKQSGAEAGPWYAF